MKKFKNAAFGVLVAGTAFGVSAFTTLKKRSVLVYYKTEMTYPNANDPRGYKYYSEDRCNSGGSLCSARWDIGANDQPEDEDPLPLSGATFQTGSESSGHFD